MIKYHYSGNLNQMAASNRRQNHQRLSALAQKYGHPVGGHHDVLYGSTELKSGLTPLDYGPFNKVEDADNLHRWELYQRKRFEGKRMILHSVLRFVSNWKNYLYGDIQWFDSRLLGFATNELEALEALAPLFHNGPTPALDAVIIHPLFQRDRWNMKYGKHQAPYSIKRGNDGFWHVSLFSWYYQSPDTKQGE